MLRGKRWARNNARSHGMHEVEHLFVRAVGISANAIKLEGLRCASAALIKRSNETFSFLHARKLLHVHDGLLFLFQVLHNSTVLIPA